MANSPQTWYMIIWLKYTIYKVFKSKGYTFVEIKTTSEIYFQKKCLRLRIFTHRRILRSRIKSNLHVGFHIRLAMWKTWRAKDKLCTWIGKSDLLNGSMMAMVCVKIHLIIYFYIETVAFRKNPSSCSTKNFILLFILWAYERWKHSKNFRMFILWNYQKHIVYINLIKICC